jgi:hypothetical protein
VGGCQVGDASSEAPFPGHQMAVRWQSRLSNALPKSVFLSCPHTHTLASTSRPETPLPPPCFLPALPVPLESAQISPPPPSVLQEDSDRELLSPRPPHRLLTSPPRFVNPKPHGQLTGNRILHVTWMQPALPFSFFCPMQDAMLHVVAGTPCSPGLCATLQFRGGPGQFV